MRKSGIWGMAALLAVALAGCGHNDGGQTATSSGSGTGTAAGTAGGGKTLEIAVIPKGTSHEYWKSIHAGAMKAKAELAAKGTNIDVEWKGTEREDDRNGQVNLVETFVTKHEDGIVLAPLDNQALTTPVHEAANAKIPVVIIDSALNGTDWVSFCATNNEKGGEMGGDQLGKLLNGKGSVLLLPYAQGSASTEDREKGFLTAMKRYPGITLLSTNQYGGPTTDTAYKTSQNLLARYGKQVNGVFASNETNTRGMLLGLKDAGLLGKVKFVGFDAADDLVQALKAQQLQGLVVQNPFKMGYTGVMTVVDAIQRKPVQKNIDTGVALVTPDNVNSPDLSEYLNPPLAQYLK